jgi:nucleoside-diphosphate-sugar epimerase
MRIFLAGATGVVGRRALALLVAAGHEVSAVARNDEKAATVRHLGGSPVGVDLFDPSGLRTVVDGHDAVVNLATKIPPPLQAFLPRAWAENERIRTEASRNLVDAALGSGVSRFVQESIAFVYPDYGDRWIDEDVELDPPRLGRPSVEAEGQTARFTASGRSGVVVRFGQFYAPDSSHTSYMVKTARRRLPALPGPPEAYAPAICADDAASAVVAALGAPAGVWNVTDDEPMTRRSFNRMVSDVVGSKPPVLTGSALLRMSGTTRFYLRSQRVSNRRFKQATGWSPRYRDAREGWEALIAVRH